MEARFYKVTSYVEVLVPNTTSKEEAEKQARDKVRRRIRNGTLRPKLWPAKWSGTGENPTVEEYYGWF